eukprot:Pompholyxophrys_sp_v1_NODE_66_length_2530_cov_5.513328.p2 type:complete len:141 gc:universal NODE_66_length_2530_cov_5.513328:1379-957(-)
MQVVPNLNTWLSHINTICLMEPSRWRKRRWKKRKVDAYSTLDVNDTNEEIQETTEEHLIAKAATTSFDDLDPLDDIRIQHEQRDEVSEAELNIMSFAIKHHLSMSAIDDLIKLLKTCDASIGNISNNCRSHTGFLLINHQ